MNPRSTARRSGALPFAVMIAMASLAACGGLIKVYYKNRGIEVGRRIAQVQDQIARHRDEIRNLRRCSDDMLNCFAMREDLDLNGSELRPIPQHAIEVIGAGDSASGVAVASNRP